MNHKTEKKQKTSKLLTVGLIAVVAVLVVNCFMICAKTSEKNREIDAIQQQIDSRQQEIDELKYLLEEGNELEYIERIARENYGYVEPGERAFYDSSAGK